MKHAYRPDCHCDRCDRERARRSRQSQDRPVATVMLDWSGSRNRRRASIAREYWENYENGRPQSADDY